MQLFKLFTINFCADENRVIHRKGGVIHEKNPYISFASVMLLGACSGEEKDNTEAQVDTKASAETTVAVKSTTIQGDYYDEMGGADAYENVGDNAESRYYKAPDFYNMESDDNLTIRENFETFQQTTEWSCGPATSLIVANHFGYDEMTEMDNASSFHFVLIKVSGT